MKFTVLLAVGLCIAAIPEVTVARAIGSVRACKPKKNHKKHSGDPEPPVVPEHLKPPIKPTCNGVICPKSEMCRLVRVQCFVPPCPVVAACVPEDESGEWLDSEESWIDDPNGRREPEHGKRTHLLPKEPESVEEKEEEEEAELLPTPHRLISGGPVIDHNKQHKGGPNAPSDHGGPVPPNQAPIYIQGPWRGDRTVSAHPGSLVIRLPPQKILNPWNPKGTYNPDSHKNPIPNSGEVPVGTRIPQGHNPSPATHVNPGPEIPEYIPHHSGSPGGPLIPGHDGKHGGPDNPNHSANPEGPSIPVGTHGPNHDASPRDPSIPVGPAKPDHDGKRGGVGIPESPYPKSPILRRGQKRDNFGWEASALHPEEMYGAGPSFRAHNPKIRACRTPKRKHRRHQRPK